MRPRNVVLQGDALAVLRTLPDASVDCVVTSPPYFQVRSYQGGAQEFGQETHVDEWVVHLRAVAAEIARVLVPWGAFWLNVGDVYASRPSEGAPAKSLLLGPERLAQALLADGWLVRNRLAGRSLTPCRPRRPTGSRSHGSSSTCWCASATTSSISTRSASHWLSADAARPRPTPDRRTCHGARDHGHSGLTRLGREGLRGHPLGKNPGDAWRIAGARVRGHGASFPAELIRRPILATCPEKVCSRCGKPWQRARHPVRFVDGKPRPRALVPCGCGAATRPGLVLDPFMGSGTVALVARKHGRDWLGIELNPEYVQLTRERLERSA